MRSYLCITALVILAVLISNGDCWGRRRRSSGSSKRGRWSLSNGGVTYTFKNGHSITGSGSLGNGGSISISYRIPIGRKRRSVEDQLSSHSEEGIASNPKPLFFKNEQLPTKGETGTQEELPTLLQQRVALEDVKQRKCDDCLEIQRLNVNDERVENKTLEVSDFVMVVKLIEEHMVAAKFEARVKFEVVEILKSPVQGVAPGQTFTIKAKMAACPCLSLLDPGLYVVTGSMNDEDKLVLSNVLLEFEE